VFASIRRYRMGAGSMDDLMHLVDTEFAEQLAAMPGFVDYQAIDTGNGTICSITMFEDEEQCLRSNDLAADWVGETLGAFDVERVEVFSGDVMVSRAADRMLVPAHH
jgi:hypothetical protein